MHLGRQRRFGERRFRGGNGIMIIHELDAAMRIEARNTSLNAATEGASAIEVNAEVCVGWHRLAYWMIASGRRFRSATPLL
jgi:hypothetical protein